MTCAMSLTQLALQSLRRFGVSKPTKLFTQQKTWEAPNLERSCAYARSRLERLFFAISMRQESRHDGSTTCELHPGIFTWNLKMDLWKLWKTIFLYKPVVFRFHVNLPECNNRLLDHHCLHYDSLTWKWMAWPLFLYKQGVTSTSMLVSRSVTNIRILALQNQVEHVLTSL